MSNSILGQWSRAYRKEKAARRNYFLNKKKIRGGGCVHRSDWSKELQKWAYRRMEYEVQLHRMNESPYKQAQYYVNL